jgi:hypothetical protein
MPNFKQSPSVARDSHRLNLPHGGIQQFKQKSTLSLYFQAVAAIIFNVSSGGFNGL